MATGDKALVLVTVRERVMIVIKRLELIENEIETVTLEMRALQAQVASAQLAKPKDVGP